MGEWRRIGCAVDFTDGCRPAVAEATRLASRTGASLFLLHAAEMPDASDLPPPAAILEATRRELAEKLEAWRGEVSATLGRPANAVLVEGAPAHALAHEAAALELDLLVAGTHGRRGFRHLVLGSVAEHLVQLAPCSVLVVRKR